jgi:hypothetical protein
MNPGEPNRGSRGDGEKASKPHSFYPRDSRVNNSTRLHSGASSRAPRLDGPGDNMARPTYHAPTPISPRNTRRSRSPYRAPHSKRRTASRSPSRSRSYSRSPSASSRRGLNDRLRSRSPARDDSARVGEKRPRSSNHYHASTNSDPRRFKVHYEQEKGDNHRDPAQPPRGKAGGNDQVRLSHHTRDDSRLARNNADLPIRHERGRLTDHGSGGNGDGGRFHRDQKMDKASHATVSNASSSAQSVYNQYFDVKQSSRSAVKDDQRAR